MSERESPSASSRARARMDRRVRREARAVLREARRGLKRHGHRVPDGIKTRIREGADALDQALADGDGPATRERLVALDELVDEHLAFARKSTAREYAESIGVAVLIALVLRAFVVEAFKIPSGSMIPTMEIGDHIFVNKFIYGLRIPFTRIHLFELRQPRRGEVVVFINPCEPDKDFIKRIVALPGDAVEVRCDQLYVNGKAVPTEPKNDTACRYWDRLDETDSAPWQHKTCSRYVETADGETYTTIYSPDRIDREKLRADSPQAAYSTLAGPRDFPDLNLPPDRRVPDCENILTNTNHVATDPRSPEQQARSLGHIEPSAASPAKGGCRLREHYVVPDGHVFVMGDNRENSSDSRAWGSVPIDNIKGKALFIWYSTKPAAEGGIQWQRIGKVVK